MLLVLNDDIFPHNLIYLRKKRKLPQAVLAQRSGINVYELRGIEKGRLRSQLLCAQYIALCDALSVSPTLMGSCDLRNTTRSDNGAVVV